MSQSLSTARDAFITSMNRDTSGLDRPRYTAVLDALIEWSLEHKDQLEFRASDAKPGVLTFHRAGSRTVFWSARAIRADAPKIDLLPGGSTTLSPERRAAARATINTISRIALEDNDRLSLGFGAMKNPANRATMFSLMDELLQAS